MSPKKNPKNRKPNTATSSLPLSPEPSPPLLHPYNADLLTDKGTQDAMTTSLSDSSMSTNPSPLPNNNSEDNEGFTTVNHKRTGTKRAHNTENSTDQLRHTKKLATTQPPTDIPNIYSLQCNGPFYVEIENHAINENGRSKPLDKIVVGAFLLPIYKNEITNINNIGHSKVEVILKSRDAANTLVSDPSIKSKNWTSQIPIRRLSTPGLIKNIPIELSEEQIMEALESSHEVLSIRRLPRTIRTDECPQQVPSRTLLINFAGQTRPNHIQLFYSRYEVEVYVSNVIICYNCYRLNHVKSQCALPSALSPLHRNGTPPRYRMP